MLSSPLPVTCALLLVASVGPVAAAPEPVLLYDFNTPGDAQHSAGSLPLTLETKVGSEPANKVGSSSGTSDAGRVLGFSGASQDTTLQASISSNPVFRESLASFTITAWVQQNASYGEIGRIFTLRGGSAPAIEFSLGGRSGEPSAPHLSVNGSPPVSSLSPGNGTKQTVPYRSDRWVFVAVTYDHADGSVVFYSAPQGETLQLWAPDRKLPAPPATDSKVLTIGNLGAPHGGRLLDANIDNVAFYNSALNEDELREIFSSPPSAE